MRTKRKSIEERFEASILPEPNSGCWLWTASCTPNGYAKISRRGKYISAHRYSFSVHNGPIEVGKCICHRCDTRSCVNPEHLFAGTNYDNLLDMTQKGRRVLPQPGSAWRQKMTEASRKLSDAQVIDIRLTDMSNEQVAEKYGVSARYVYLIKTKKARAQV